MDAFQDRHYGVRSSDYDLRDSRFSSIGDKRTEHLKNIPRRVGLSVNFHGGRMRKACYVWHSCGFEEGDGGTHGGG